MRCIRQKNLGQLLSNMQDGMRAYFDELSRMKDFIGIQKVLIKEINNSDSRCYAILTTTDSFYRYKEAVKELISKILIRTMTEGLSLRKFFHRLHPVRLRENAMSTAWSTVIRQVSLFIRWSMSLT